MPVAIPPRGEYTIVAVLSVGTLIIVTAVMVLATVSLYIVVFELKGELKLPTDGTNDDSVAILDLARLTINVYTVCVVPS